MCSTALFLICLHEANRERLIFSRRSTNKNYLVRTSFSWPAKGIDIYFRDLDAFVKVIPLVSNKDLLGELNHKEQQQLFLVVEHGTISYPHCVEINMV